VDVGPVPRRHWLLVAGQVLGELALGLGFSVLYTGAEERKVRVG